MQDEGYREDPVVKGSKMGVFFLFGARKRKSPRKKPESEGRGPGSRPRLNRNDFHARSKIPVRNLRNVRLSDDKSAV